MNFQEVVHSIQAVNAEVAKQKRFAEDRMDTHKNARLTPTGREEMVRAVGAVLGSEQLRSEPRHLLPKDLAGSLKRLDNAEFDSLLTAVTAEAAKAKPARRRTALEEVAGSLTKGKLNAACRPYSGN